MTNIVDESELFDAEVLAATADEYGLDAEVLGEAIARHQRSMAELPGIENLAYEWRKQYESPLIERSPAAYHFAVPERVWDEFADALDVREAERGALVEVHRQTTVSRTAAAPEPAGGLAYVVLDRGFDDRSPENR